MVALPPPPHPLFLKDLANVLSLTTLKYFFIVIPLSALNLAHESFQIFLLFFLQFCISSLAVLSCLLLILLEQISKLFLLTHIRFYA